MTADQMEEYLLSGLIHTLTAQTGVSIIDASKYSTEVESAPAKHGLFLKLNSGEEFECLLWKRK